MAKVIQWIANGIEDRRLEARCSQTSSYYVVRENVGGGRATTLPQPRLSLPSVPLREMKSACARGSSLSRSIWRLVELEVFAFADLVRLFFGSLIRVEVGADHSLASSAGFIPIEISNSQPCLSRWGLRVYVGER